MKIGINCQPLSIEHFSGISHYLNEILHVWANNAEHSDDEIFLMSSKEIKIDFELPDNWTVVIDDVKKGMVWETLGVVKTIHKLGLDVYWAPNFVLPLLRVSGCRYYVTIHDLALLRFPEVVVFKLKLRAHYLAKHSARIATKVLTVSEASADDICEFFGTPREKIVVGYNGAGTVKRQPDNAEQTQNAGILNNVETASNVEKDDATTKVAETSVDIIEGVTTKTSFFLFIGTLEPRKNIITIVKAFEKCMDDMECSHNPIHHVDSDIANSLADGDCSSHTPKLVLAGANGWKSEELDNTINNSKYKENIILPGYISKKEKDELLSHAIAFLFPSLYEGFGIPILEAFAYNLPVITTAVSSMPEVAKDAAFYIDNPLDYEALAKQMKKVSSLSDEDKSELTKLMQAQLDEFTWERTAGITYEAFKQ